MRAKETDVSKQKGEQPDVVCSLASRALFPSPIGMAEPMLKPLKEEGKLGSGNQGPAPLVLQQRRGCRCFCPAGRGICFSAASCEKNTASHVIVATVSRPSTQNHAQCCLSFILHASETLCKSQH